MSHEKEEFYMRLNRSYMEQIKSLENQLAEQQMKFTERESNHRQQLQKYILRINELSARYGDSRPESEMHSGALMKEHYLQQRSQLT